MPPEFGTSRKPLESTGFRRRGTGAATIWRGEASSPAISRIGNRLAYKRGPFDSNIWRLPLAGPGVASGPPARFIASTRQDLAAQYSPDGKRIAFESDRSGVYGIWISDADGSHAVDLLFTARRELRDGALVAGWATYRL